MQAYSRVRYTCITAYAKSRDIGSNERIFPISYVAAGSMVKKAGMLVNIELCPHDLLSHAATYASRSGTPIEIVSKVILRNADLSTTQRCLGEGKRHRSNQLDSLIEIAKANGLEPYKYLRYLFEHLPFAETEDEYGKLLPSNLGEADLALSRMATGV